MNTSRILAVAALSLAGSSVAMAGTVNMAFSGSAIAKNVRVNLVTTDGTENLHVRAGQLLHNVDTTTNSTGINLASQILTYCTDLLQTTNNGMTPYSVMNPADAPQPGQAMGPTAAQNLARLYGYELGQANNAFSSAANNQRTAAFQIAIWEIVYDSDNGPFDVSDGDFMLDSGLNAQGLAFLSTFLDQAINGVDQASLRALVSQDGQDQLIIVPLPGAGAMAFAGLAGLAGVRRRR